MVVAFLSTKAKCAVAWFGNFRC